jgi:ubiquinone biosynthesis UbiH/UbiF/VisC/COQ6 family hydroxylase
MRNNVLIIGAGPVGLCLSLALAKRGMDVDLIERQGDEVLAAPAYDGREIALTQASMRLLRTLGVWPHIAEDAIASVARAHIMDGADDGFVVDAAALGRGRLGVLASNHAIRAAAWQAVAAEPRIRVHAGVAVERARTDAVSAHVHLADGSELEAALLVAADSRFSETRRGMGIPVHMHDMGMSMLLCRVQHAEANHGTAWEWFGQEQTRALLPLRERLSSVVLTVPDGEAQRLQHLAPDALAEELAARYEGRLGAMSVASTVHRYPLVATWARRFVGRRFALIGDAAIGMHPVTAHGFNLGLAGVEHLAAATGDAVHRHGDPAHPSLLVRYQRRLRINSALLFAGTQTVAGLFTDQRAHARPLRHGIMRLGRKLPAVRRALAASLVDDTPRPASLPHHLHTAFDILRPRLGPSHVHPRA